MSVLSDPLIGRNVAGKYAIESLLGTGAMGSVYAARHATLDTVVAVKVLHKNLATDAAFAERFHREAKSASRLHHPNVIQVIDFGREPDGLFYIAMEYVDGVDLFQTLQREWPLNDRRLGDIVCQILSGVAAAHDIGIVHRDLKPENVIVTRALDDEGRPQELAKVCDFCIAKFDEPGRAPPSGGTERTLTTSGLLLGTPQYMSPEQCRGDALDARTDVYSVGIILYQMLTGRLPFQAQTTVDVVIQQVTEEPVPPSKVYPGVSPALEAVCLRALRKLPEERYASAREMRAGIRAVMDSPPWLGAGASPVPPPVTGMRKALPSPPPHAFAAPTLGSVSPTKVSGDAEPGRPRVRGVWTYAAALVLLAGVGLSVSWFRSKSTAVRAPSAAVSAASALPAGLAPPPAQPAPPVEPVSTAEALDPAASKSAKEVRKGKSGRHSESTVAPAESVPGTPAAPEPPLPEPPLPAATGPVVATVARELAPSPPVVALNADSGSVSWRVSAVGGGATAGGVVRALSRAASSWTGCYRSGLRSRGRRVEGTGLLRLSCDEQGRVINAALSGLDMPDVLACIRGTTAGITIPNADTGEAWATVAMSFRVND